jgi:hypothetical protein
VEPLDGPLAPGAVPSLTNRVSSYANFSTSTYCVYDLKRDGRTRILLWRMKPGGTSRWVGRARTRDGRSVNDRADLLAPC